MKWNNKYTQTHRKHKCTQLNTHATTKPNKRHFKIINKKIVIDAKKLNYLVLDFLEGPNARGN